MKQLTCEMCGSTDIVKQEGLFVCQTCGVKYTIDEAKKLFEGTVDIRGAVKIDHSDDLKKLYEAARLAKQTNNSIQGYKYYDEILKKEPLSWEANFYTAYYGILNSRLIDFDSNMLSLTNVVQNSLQLIKENLPAGRERSEAIKEVSRRICQAAPIFFEAIKTKYNKRHISVVVNSYFPQLEREQEPLLLSLKNFVQMLSSCGDLCVEIFKEDSAAKLSAKNCREKALEICKKIYHLADGRTGAASSLYNIKKKLERLLNER